MYCASEKKIIIVQVGLRYYLHLDLEIKFD